MHFRSYSLTLCQLEDVVFFQFYDKCVCHYILIVLQSCVDFHTPWLLKQRELRIFSSTKLNLKI